MKNFADPDLVSKSGVSRKKSCSKVEKQSPASWGEIAPDARSWWSGAKRVFSSPFKAVHRISGSSGRAKRTKAARVTAAERIGTMLNGSMHT